MPTYAALLLLLAAISLVGCRTSSLPFEEPVSEVRGGSVLTATWSTTADGQSIGVVEGPRPATLKTTTVGDIPETVAIEVGGATVTFSLVQGATLQNRGDVLSIQSSDGDAIALIVDDGDSTFEHQTFGAWISGLTFGQGSVGAGSFGARTGDDRVPVGTTATYTGASSGFV